jgi:ferredoxin-NADP reductase
MAKVSQWHPLSRDVSIFRLKADPGERFPDYIAGQNIQLFRAGEALLYSIVSAPFETQEHNFLEFFVNRDRDFSEGDQVTFSDSAFGDFTLGKTLPFQNVIFVGTGTGVAPFVSMVRTLSKSADKEIRYTLLHASRNFAELGYDKELSAIEAHRKFDFVYIPTVSRPSADDLKVESLGKGRAGNLLRNLLNLPPKGEAVLPACLQNKDWQERLDPRCTIILACGSHASVSDVQDVARETGIPFVKEDW